MNMVCGKVEVIINAMVATCMAPQDIADKAGVSVNIIYRIRKGVHGKDGAFREGLQGIGTASRRSD